MSKTFKEVFDPHFAKVKFDKKLARELHRYVTGFIGKNHEHIEFFGGNLIGVQRVRFTDADRSKFFAQVLDIDEVELEQDVKHAHLVPANYKVASDLVNQVLMYMIHRLKRSQDFTSEVDRQSALHDAAALFFARTLVILIADYFTYQTDKAIAQAAYARLSRKFLIKELGNWLKVIDYRADDLTGKESIHLKTLHEFEDTAAIIYCINDSQGRIRDLVKNYNKEFYATHAEGDSIAATLSTTIDADGEEVLKERTKSVESLINYAQQILIDPNTFIRDDYVALIAKINTNTSGRMIKHVMQWLCDHYGQVKHHAIIADFVSRVVIYSNYLMDNSIEPSRRRDYAHVLVELKNLYLSTRSTDPDLFKIRELGEQLITLANPKKLSESIISATRTSIILYITFRVLIGHKS